MVRLGQGRKLSADNRFASNGLKTQYKRGKGAKAAPVWNKKKR